MSSDGFILAMGERRSRCVKPDMEKTHSIPPKSALVPYSHTSYPYYTYWFRLVSEAKLDLLFYVSLERKLSHYLNNSRNKIKPD
jgi:hypothetical protein